MEGHIQTSSRCCDWPLRMIAGPEEKIFTESLKRLYYLSYYDLNRGRNMDLKAILMRCQKAKGHSCYKVGIWLTCVPADEFDEREL